MTTAKTKKQKSRDDAGLGSAQWFMPMRDGVTAQMYYRLINIKYNDGSNEDTLHYWSSCGSGWMPSGRTFKDQKDQEVFIKSKLIPLTRKKGA